MRDETREGGEGRKTEGLRAVLRTFSFMWQAVDSHWALVSGQREAHALWTGHPCSRMQPEHFGAKLEACAAGGQPHPYSRPVTRWPGPQQETGEGSTARIGMGPARTSAARGLLHKRGERQSTAGCLSGFGPG